MEEHSVIGGLGSAVCDVLSEKAPTKVLKIGVNDVLLDRDCAEMAKKLNDLEKMKVLENRLSLKKSDENPDVTPPSADTKHPA